MKQKELATKDVTMNDSGQVLSVEIQACVFVLPLKGYDVYEWVDGKNACGRRDRSRKYVNFFDLNLN